MSALDRDYDNRSYCFGRIAAVYEIAERSTFSPKYYQEPLVFNFSEGFFIKHPGDALAKLEAHMCNGVWVKLNPASREFFRQEISDILDKLDAKEEIFTKPLDYHFTEGYYHERSWLRDQIKEKKDDRNAK